MYVAGCLMYIQQYFYTSTVHHSSDKSGLKVADCTFQSAEYQCFYGTNYKSLENALTD